MATLINKLIEYIQKNVLGNDFIFQWVSDHCYINNTILSEIMCSIILNKFKQYKNIFKKYNNENLINLVKYFKRTIIEKILKEFKIILKSVNY